MRRLYDRNARFYDVCAAPYQWLGGRALQRRALEELRLSSGDTVVDLGTGTGWNLPLLAEIVGPAGRVVGVDLSEAMLALARRRVDVAGWNNVDLVQGDIREVALPEGTEAVVATFAMEMIPEHDQVIARIVSQLAPGCRIALVGLREPDGWPEWCVRLGSLLNRPFGTDPAYRDITPWTSIDRHLNETIRTTAMLGAVYMAAGTTPD